MKLRRTRYCFHATLTNNEDKNSFCVMIYRLYVIIVIVKRLKRYISIIMYLIMYYVKKFSYLNFQWIIWTLTHDNATHTPHSMKVRARLKAFTEWGGATTNPNVLPYNFIFLVRCTYVQFASTNYFVRSKYREKTLDARYTLRLNVRWYYSLFVIQVFNHTIYRIRKISW